jgi:hypothetical protein
MSVCSNLWFDRSSRLAAYAGYVVLLARLRAQRAHQCALAIAEPLIFIADPQWVFVPMFVLIGQPFGRLYWTWDAVRTFARA